MGVPPPAYESQTEQSLPIAQAPHNPNAFQQQQIQHQPEPPQAVYTAQPQIEQHKSSHQVPMAQPGYQQQQAQMGQPYPIPLASLLQSPAWVQCPSCAQVQMTRVEFVSGTSTHLWAAALCLCFCLGCIPYCVSGMKNVEHHCGHCGTLLATYKRGSGTEVNAGAGAGSQVPMKA